MVDICVLPKELPIELLREMLVWCQRNNYDVYRSDRVIELERDSYGRRSFAIDIIHKEGEWSPDERS